MTWNRINAALMVLVLAFWAIDELAYREALGPQWLRPIIVGVLFLGMSFRIWRGWTA